MQKDQLFQKGIALHQELLQLCDREEDCIVQNRVGRLMELVEWKERKIAEIKDWERLCRTTPLHSKDAPAQAHELKRLVEKVQVKMAQIMNLLQTSLEYIYAQIDGLAEDGSLALYSSHGEEVGHLSHGASLFSRRV